MPASYDDILANMDADEKVHNYVPPKPKPPKPKTSNSKLTMPMFQPVGKEYVSNYNAGNIGKMWEDLTNSQIGVADANLSKEKGQIDSQRTKAADEYRGLSNQASANHAMQQRAQRESMANMGLSAAGGTSRSAAQSAVNNLNNQVGSIKRQEKQYNEEVDRALRDLQSKYSAEVNNIMANNNVQRTTQQIQSDQWEAGHNLDATKYNTGLGQWNTQFATEQEMAKLNLLLDLVRSKVISRGQLEELVNEKFL